MLKRIHLAITILLALLLAASVMGGIATARRARQEAHRALAMQMQARMMAEEALRQEQASRERAVAAEAAAEQLKAQTAPTAPAPK